LFWAESKFCGETYLLINLRYLVKVFFEAGSLCREEEENPSIINYVDSRPSDWVRAKAKV